MKRLGQGYPISDARQAQYVVDPLRQTGLRAIAEKAGFSRETIDVWERNYLVPYNPDVQGDIERASKKAEDRIAQRLSGVQPTSIFTLPDALNEFSARLKAILESFGLTFQSSTLSASVIEALYKAAQA